MFVETFDYCRGAHSVMSQQNTLDFNRRDPLAGRLETIVAAPLMPPETIGIRCAETTSSHPTTQEGLGRRLRPPPITRGCAGAANPEIPRLTAGCRNAIMINQTRLIATQ